MVAHDSSSPRNEEIDRGGTRVGVIVGSAYDLFLSRELKQATIVRAADAAAVMDLWVAGKLDAVAGVKPQLEADAKRVGGLRLLPRRFMAINQAMGTPRERDTGARYLRASSTTSRRRGFVARSVRPQPDRRRVAGAVAVEGARAIALRRLLKPKGGCLAPETGGRYTRRWSRWST